MSLASKIDHTMLKAEATASQIENLCHQAHDYGFATVCVNPFWVPFAAKLLHDSPVGICTVVGFALGASQPKVKAYETAIAIEQGATEIDMVANIGALKSSEFDTVRADIAAVRAAAGGAIVKVIIEAAVLNADELATIVDCAAECGANFIKTSTGMHPSGGARVSDIRAIAAVLHNRTVGIKASGGIRTYEQARELVDAGASRIGTSVGIQIEPPRVL